MPLNTGNPYLDALGGSAWQPVNGSVILSFVFSTAGNGGAWTAEESQIGALAVGAWLDVANIGFDDPADVEPGYEIDFLKVTSAQIDPPTALGEASYPDMSFHVVKINIEHPAWEYGLEPGGLGFQALIHELGHALGLAHPHDKDMGTGLFPGIEEVSPGKGDPHDSGTYDLNTIPYTIMGYNLPEGMSEPDPDLGLSYDAGFMVTPGAFDIAAIQLMYGAVAHNEGDTIYKLNGNFDGLPTTSFTTIWDTGGNDTIEYVPTGDPVYDNDSGVVIDLRYATLKEEPGGGGFLSHFVGPRSNNGGFTIAADVTNFLNDGDALRGVIIENAIGGPGRDELIGNEVTNVLKGLGGDDQISGLGGSDNLIGGLGADILRGGLGDDVLTGGDGTGPDDKSDTFVFEPGWGHDTITDFVLGTDGFPRVGDVLAFGDVTGIKSLSQFEMTEDEDGLTLGYEGNFITILGIKKGDLKDWNLQFNRKLEDGYLSGATVFADANNNGELDAGESSTTTDAAGTFVLAAGSGPLVAFGGTDTSTGLPFKGRLLAPYGSVVITPLTTLLVEGVSEADLLAALGLPSGFDLRLGDPIAGLLAGHAGSAAVFVEGAKVIDTVIAIATAIAGLGGDEAEAQQDVFAAIAAAINALGTGETLDLSDPAVIAALVETVAEQQGINAEALVDAISNAIAGANATIDDHLANDGASADLLTHVSTVQQDVQSNQSPVAVDDSAHVVKGTTLTGNILTNDSDPDGDALQLISVEGGNIGDTIAGKYGALTVEADGSFTYVANKNNLPSRYAAQDSIDYSITDGAGGAASGTLSVLVLGKNQLYQSGINTTLTGTRKGDVLDGSGGGVTAIGDKGADILIGGIGNTLTGNKGTDIFLFRADFGANTITDFDWKRGDVIQIDASVFQTVEDVLAHTHDSVAGAVIDDGAGNVITLSGVLFSQLQTNDFHIG